MTRHHRLDKGVILIQNLLHEIRGGSRTVISLILAMLSSTMVVAAEDHKNSRIIFNDDAQVLSESPLEKTSAFVRGWLDREVAHVPFTTFVFLAATPDICTYQTKAGETFGRKRSEKWGRRMKAMTPHRRSQQFFHQYMSQRQRIAQSIDFSLDA